jgi:N-acetylmuramoyl-L-alanine amidase
MPDLNLKNTIRYLNTNGNATTDLAIEIHKDAIGDTYNDAQMKRRVGLYYMRDGIGGNLRIAGAMIRTMQNIGAHPTSWIRPDTESNHKQLGFCRKTKMLSMIAELGFIEGSNATDENEWYAWALTKAILQVLEKPILVVPINFTTIFPEL